MGGECSHSVTNVLHGYGDLETEHPRETPSAKSEPYGVSDGARTRDIPDHNRMLYQLSYAHHGYAPQILPVTGVSSLVR